MTDATSPALPVREAIAGRWPCVDWCCTAGCTSDGTPGQPCDCGAPDGKGPGRCTCGHAEIRALAAERDRLRNDLASCLRTLDQILAPGMWTERLTIRPVPWDEWTVNVARGVVEVARLDEWTAGLHAVDDRNPGVFDA